jgi:hypothetical protein
MISVPGSSTPVPVPFVSQGTLNVDHQGRFTLHSTISLGGKVQEGDVGGSIQVNPDCTATETDAAGGVGRMVILDHGNEMRAMATKSFLAPMTGIAYFRRISWSEPHCTSAMVRGVYGGSGVGTHMIPVPGQSQPVPVPYSAIFSMTFQPNGSGTGEATASMAGNVWNVQFPAFSIAVNPDCTAVLNWKATVFEQTSTGTVKYIVLDDGNELIGMETANSIGLPIELENHKRISVTPVPLDR